jgi:hypothetical protein
MATAMKTKLTVEIRQTLTHLTYDEFWNGIVTTARGLCYYCTWTGDKPSEEKVLTAWREDRKAFQPYNCMTGGH